MAKAKKRTPKNKTGLSKPYGAGKKKKRKPC